ncbi:MAG TPA: hypothetical protein VGC41_27565, partial [Kofleriaceae bacterium]
FMECVALQACDAFSVPGGWPVESVRVLLTTWLTLCPPSYLDEAVIKAKHELDSECFRELENPALSEAA